VIIGSSNITRNGVHIAVKWNAILRRGLSNPDIGVIIASFDETFHKYTMDPQYRLSLLLWRVKSDNFQLIREAIRKLLLSDDEIVSASGSLELKKKLNEVRDEIASLREVSQNELLSLAEWATKADLYFLSKAVKKLVRVLKFPPTTLDINNALSRAGQRENDTRFN
jgi:hypothetical protein